MNAPTDSRNLAAPPPQPAPQPTPQPTPQPVPQPVPQPGEMLRWVVAVAFFMQMLDGTILNTALPAIARDFGEAPLRMQSAVIAYMLTAALLIPASGWLAEHFGTRRTFLFAIFLFSFGSLLCATSNTLNYLVIYRVIQGVGGALMAPVGRLVVIKAYPRSELIRQLSFIAIPSLIGPLAGPVAGGFLAEYASWRWIFLINIPAGMIGFFLAWRNMPNFKAKSQWKFDTPGFLLFGAAMVLVTLAMEGFGELNLPKNLDTLLAAAGFLFFGAYWLRAVRTEHPLFETDILRIPTFSIGVVGNLFARLGSGGMPFLLPLFLQLGLGFSPFAAGGAMIPSALAAIFGKSLIPRLVQLAGFRLFLTANTIIVGLMIASFASVTAETPYVWLLAHIGVFGIFNSMQFTTMNSVTLIDLPLERAGSGNSLLSVSTQVSVSSGVALAAIVLNGFNAEFGGGTTAIPVGVFSYTFLCIGIFNAAVACIFVLLPGGSGKE